VKQLAQIERRQARISRIKSQTLATVEVDDENIDSCPDGRYAIGNSQNSPVDLTDFVQKHEGDPAIKVCIYNATR
jgi:hypothetical protein